MKSRFALGPFLLGSILLSVCGSVTAQPLSMAWATTFGHSYPGSKNENLSPCILVETNGCTRLIGACHAGRGTFTFGPTDLPPEIFGSNESADIYLARIDADGNPTSVSVIPRTGWMAMEPPHAAIDATGNLVVAIELYGDGVNTTFAGVSIPGGSRLTILAKFDAADQLLWVKKIPYASVSTYGSFSIAVDDDGNVIIGGSFSGMLNIDGVVLDGGPTSVNGVEQRELFAAKFSPAGVLKWARKAGGVETAGVYKWDQVLQIATDSTGNVYIGGATVNGASFGGKIVSTAADYDVFVAQLSPGGDFNWVFTPGSAGSPALASVINQGLRMSPDNRPILAYHALSNDGQDQVFLTVLDSSGQPSSVIPPVITGPGGNAQISFVGMEVSDVNELFLIAWVDSGTLHFGGRTLSTAPYGGRLVFAGGLRFDGNWNWVQSVARPQFPTSLPPERYFSSGGPLRSGLAVSHGTMRFAGVYLSPEDFPLADGTLPASAPEDRKIFLAKLTPPPTPPSLTAAAGSGGSTLVLTWPTNATGFIFQSATTLTNGGDWQDATNAPTEINGQKEVTITPTGPCGYFRLRGL